MTAVERDVLADLKAVVRGHESSRPRSLQRSIGPSEAGAQCGRRLAYRMLGVEPVNTDSDPWAAIVGTAVHEWLDTAFADENARLGWDRWETSVKVRLGSYMGGTIDLYDHLTKTVIDHKVVGATTMRAAKKGTVSEQYRVQAHLYATGLKIDGYDVEHVAIAYWSRPGLLRDAVWWTEPYDEDIVERTLARLDALKDVTAAGTAILPMIPTADVSCGYCPFYLPASTDATRACAGHAGAAPTAAPAA